MASYVAIGKVNMKNLGKEIRQKVDGRQEYPLWVVTVPKGYEIRDPSGNVVATLGEQGFEANSNDYKGLHNAIEMAYVHHTRS